MKRSRIHAPTATPRHASRAPAPRKQPRASALDSGMPLDAETREHFDSAFGHDFSRVRVHAGDAPRRACDRFGADAFTHGEHVFLRDQPPRPDTPAARELWGHELTHVLQQRAAGSGPRPLLNRPGDASEAAAEKAAHAGALGPGAVHAGAVPQIQRRLRVTGSNADIDTLIVMLEAATGIDLEHNAAANEIVAIGSLVTTGATSTTAETILTTVLDDPGRDAELSVGQAQPRVMVGAFPVPHDLTGGIVQQIDIADLEVMEAGAPGHGAAVLMHEIQENYHAHSLTPLPGIGRYDESHAAARTVESDVAEELVGPGRRGAFVRAPAPGGTEFFIDDFDTYYRVREASGSTLIAASVAPRLVVATYTIDGFVTNSDVVPAAGAANIAAAVADLAANPTATVRIDGFTDNVGTPGDNRDLGRRRAESARAAIRAGGATGGNRRFRIVGAGATSFVAPNTTDPDRARNRRVVITIERPDI